jgi:hypothetical protein
LIGGNTLLVLNLSLHILNGVGWLDVKSDGLTGEGLDEDLHTSSESENEMEGWLLLDVVVWQGSSVFQLLSGENESLLIGRDAFLVLNLGLDVFNGVTGLHIEGDGLASQGLHEDLHTTSKSEDQVEGRFFLDVVVTEGSAVFELLASEDESLLVRWDTFFVLDLSLDVLDGVRGLNVQCNGLSS